MPGHTRGPEGQSDLPGRAAVRRPATPPVVVSLSRDVAVHVEPNARVRHAV